MRARHGLLALAAVALLPLVACEPTDPAVERVSRTFDGGVPNGPSVTPAISDGGRFVAFVSEASNIQSGDGNGSADVFVHDRSEHFTDDLTRGGDGPSGWAPSCFAFDRGEPTCGNEPSRPEAPAISDDGRYVAFTSFARNLDGPVAAPSNIYVFDRQTFDTTLVSRSTAGAPGNGPSLSVAISGNGRVVTFWSYADNLVPGDTNGSPDVFTRDLVTGTTRRVDTTSAGAQAGRSFESWEYAWPGSELLSVDVPSPVSDDGRYVAFLSVRTDLGPPGSFRGAIYRKDLQTGALLQISDPALGNRGEAPYISGDGNFVSYATAFFYDVNRDAPCGVCFNYHPTGPLLRVVRNVSAARTTEIIPGNPFPGAPDVSGDGTLRVFALGGDASQVYLRHLPTTALVARHRINTGGPQFSGALLKTWDADRGFVGGHSHSVTNPIAFTVDDPLYQSERWGMSAYRLPVPDGRFRVRLLVAEISPTTGPRVFDVRAEGALVVDDFDIRRDFHAFEATTLEFVVPVTDGQLDLGFSASSNAATVAAIEVLDARLPDERIAP
jgi:Tol biopolymer transport system component